MNPSNPEYNYTFYLFSMLIRDIYFTQQEDMDYDLMYTATIDLYQDFMASEFNTQKQSYYETMQHYIVNLIG
jgi:hypothetical protein